MRTFIAISLPQNVKARLAQLQETLKKSGADVKWVDPQNIHLTLKFLGEIDQQQIATITKAVEEVALTTGSFRANLNILGAFPKLEFARVIWVGLENGDSQSKVIAQALEEKIEMLGIPKEKREFSSHITIGRVRSFLKKDKLAQAITEENQNFGQEKLEFAVTAITLYKSTLTPKGPAYEALKEVNLQTT